MEKHISNILQNEEINGTNLTRPPIYVLCCIKDPSLSNIKKYPQSDYCVQCHSGTIRNFVECKKMISFLNYF